MVKVMVLRSSQHGGAVAASVTLLLSCSSGGLVRRADGSAPQFDATTDTVSQAALDGDPGEVVTPSVLQSDATTDYRGPQAVDVNHGDVLAPSDGDPSSSGDGRGLIVDVGNDAPADDRDVGADAIMGGGSQSCPVLTGGPTTTGPLPSAAQLAY